MLMKFAVVDNFTDKTDREIMDMLTDAHSNIRMLQKQMKEDAMICQLQHELEVLRDPYKLRTKYYKQVVETLELIARSRGIFKKVEVNGD